jgi:hypothetical protein
MNTLSRESADFFNVKTDCAYTGLQMGNRNHYNGGSENHVVEFKQITVEPGYNDIGLYVTSFIASDTLWYGLISHC